MLGLVASILPLISSAAFKVNPRVDGWPDDPAAFIWYWDITPLCVKVGAARMDGNVIAPLNVAADGIDPAKDRDTPVARAIR